METHGLLSTLSLVTLAAVVVACIWQFVRVRRSQARRGEKPGGMAGPEP
jgi:hypothetical protein